MKQGALVAGAAGGASMRDMPPAGQRILLVDDSPADLTELADALGAEGYELSLARSGEEALQRLVEDPVDAIVLDMVLPGLSGQITCRLIKEAPAWRAIPLLMLTGRGDEQAFFDAISAGADDFVVKSSELTALKARLLAQLRRRHFEEDSRRARDLLLRREIDAAEAMADQELRRSEERFRLIVEGIQDYAIFMLDPEGRVVSWNPGAERITGYQLDEIVGHSCAALFTPEDAARGAPAAELEATVQAGRSVQEGFRLRKDGTRYWAHEVISALRDDGGRLRGFVMVSRDATERHRVQEAQRVLLAAGKILDESLDFEDTLRRVVRVAIPDFASICVLLLQDQEGAIERKVTTHADPAMAADAEPLGALTVPLIARGRTLGTLYFAATHRRYDAADLELAQNLAARAALAVDNARLYREAQEAVRARDEFLTLASHELRTPLTPIQLQVDWLLRGAQRGALTADRALPRVQVIERQVTRLARRIQTLLDVSGPSFVRLQLELEDVDLSAVAREAVARACDEIAAAGCAVHVDAPGPIVGRWDRVRLDQVVTNLLLNAIKYGAGKPIEVRVEDLPRGARLTVRDHGIGIAEEQQARIFRRFERAVPSESYGGFGLGLWIVERIADALGASVGVTSRPGEGAAFTVELPKAAG